jgi:hypothetical protein
MPKLKARLENWVVLNNNTLLGDIYNDSRGNPDGTRCMTSQLLPMSMQVSTPKEGVKIFTQNTIYLLGKKG